MTDPPPGSVPTPQAAEWRARHRQFLREKLLQVALAPNFKPGTERRLNIAVSLFVFLLPLAVLTYATVNKWGVWTTVAVFAVQGVGAVGIFAWLWRVTPRSFSIYAVSSILRNAFRKEFGCDPVPDDLEDSIQEMDQPALTAWQSLADLILERLPVSWSVLILVGVVGTSVLPLLSIDLGDEKISPVRTLALGLGIAFASLEVSRLFGRQFHLRRLSAAREWLRQLQQGAVMKPLDWVSEPGKGTAAWSQNTEDARWQREQQPINKPRK